MAARKGQLEKSDLELLVSQNLSTREIGNKLNRGQTSIRYWLKFYNLKTNLACFSVIAYNCSFCGDTNPDNFYGKKKTRCGKCHNKDVIERARENKRKARKYLGGSCVYCGFDKYQTALDFHHVDPSLKDPKFSQMSTWGWERIFQEIKKCILLCSNCHKAYHSGELKAEFIIWV